jgi:ubiquitin C-terminal hydrolase
MSMFSTLSRSPRCSTMLRAAGKSTGSSVGSSRTRELLRYPNPSIRIGKNTGVSCYVNCVLSCLFSIPAVRTMILEAKNDIQNKLRELIYTRRWNKSVALLESFSILALCYCEISLSGTITTITVYIYIYIYI